MKKDAASLPADLKISNRKLVLEAFYKKGAVSTTQIADTIGLSRQTVKKCINYYLENGTLESDGKGSSTAIGGKKPDVYQFNSALRIVSITLHHHDVTVTYSDLQCRAVGQWSSGHMDFACLDMIYDCIRKGAEALSASDPEGTVLAVVMSGPLGHTKDYRLLEMVPFPSWPKSDYIRDIKRPLQDIFPTAKRVDLYSDGQAAGAALLYREPEVYSSCVFASVYTSVGIGGSLYINGVSQGDRMVFIGSMGHVIVAPEDPEVCFCGSHGCLERQVSKERLRQRLGMKPDEYKNSVLARTPLETLTYTDIFKGSAMGDALCQRESRRCAQYFAVALKNLAVYTGPDYIVIQGEFSKADAIFRLELEHLVFSAKVLSNYEGKIIYDEYPLHEEETLGCNYRMLRDFIDNNERYTTDA